MRWDDKKPIYQQLRDKIVEAIIDGSYVEGEMIPSIRKSARNIKSIRSLFPKLIKVYWMIMSLRNAADWVCLLKLAHVNVY